MGSSHSEAGRLAAEHLLQLGHREIGMVTGPPARRVVATRTRAFRAALSAAGVHMPAGRTVASEWTSEGGYVATQHLLAQNPKLTAIYAHNDMIAMGVLSALRDSGRRVPDDCAVVGCDDIPFAAYLIPPLTTVHQPMRKIGERGCDRLLERIMDPTLRPRIELLPAELVLRSSCGCPSGTVTRHHVASISRRKAGSTAKAPCPPSRVPPADPMFRSADPLLQPTNPLAQLANDEITER